MRVVLTSKGKRLVDRALELRFAEAEDAVASLTERERAALEKALRKMLLSLEGTDQAPR